MWFDKRVRSCIVGGCSPRELQIVDMLAYPKLVQENRVSPLHLAVFEGSLELSKLLLSVSVLLAANSFIHTDLECRLTTVRSKKDYPMICLRPISKLANAIEVVHGHPVWL
eukprot:6473312-Amphidinium_carterae.2